MKQKNKAAQDLVRLAIKKKKKDGTLQPHMIEMGKKRDEYFAKRRKDLSTYKLLQDTTDRVY